MKERISEIPIVAPIEQSSPKALSTAELSDSDYLRTIAKGKLVEIIRGNSATPTLVPAIKELLDRIDGKAKERIEANITGHMVHFNIKEGSELILQGIKDKLAKRRVLLIDSDKQ